MSDDKDLREREAQDEYAAFHDTPERERFKAASVTVGDDLPNYIADAMTRGLETMVSAAINETRARILAGENYSREEKSFGAYVLSMTTMALAETLRLDPDRLRRAVHLPIPTTPNAVVEGDDLA